MRAAACTGILAPQRSLKRKPALSGDSDACIPLAVPRAQLALGCALACGTLFASAAGVAAPVDAKRIGAAADNRADWLTHGRTYDEQRFSPLARSIKATSPDLKLAWYFDLDTTRGQEATPLVIDGTMYVTSAWSKVFALDARTGKAKWRFDPQVAGAKAIDACCDVVNRGVAAWGQRLRRHARRPTDRARHDERQDVWSVQTTDPKKRYTITGAPRVIEGKVIIGNGGGEMGVRGYVSAYDATTGKMLWRFYTVPGNPKDGFENPRWSAPRRPGTANGGSTAAAAPCGIRWPTIRSSTSSTSASATAAPGTIASARTAKATICFCLRSSRCTPDTGEYVWHFQTTPAESWDFTATQHIILADLTIDGRPRKVLMQAPKNGFFYVLDRTTGEFIQARTTST